MQFERKSVQRNSLLLFLSLVLTLICSACAPAASEIVIDWGDLTYEQIRGFEEIPLATRGELTLMLSDLLYVYGPFTNSSYSAGFTADQYILQVAQSIYDEPSLRSAVNFTLTLGNAWAYAIDGGWDGVPNDTARAVADWRIAEIDRDLAALSDDLETAARLYTVKYLTTPEYHKKWVLRDAGAYYFLMEKDVSPETLSDYYSEIVEKDGLLSLGILVKNMDAAFEEMYLDDLYQYMREGNSLITYAPAFDYGSHKQNVFPFTIYPDNESYSSFSWIQTAEEGDFHYDLEAGWLWQAIRSDESALKYHYNLMDSRVYRWVPIPDDSWTVDEELMKRIKIADNQNSQT
ncbi:MAG: hypothetical protein LBK56_11340 [Gracilibacteraceae bacterium]|jgi:hypothetical protein|nr:hypothetical protein [Gracilibacteraceae bacterium]